jgi:hypothetical protein
MSKICWRNEASSSHTKRFGNGASSNTEIPIVRRVGFRNNGLTLWLA